MPADLLVPHFARLDEYLDDWMILPRAARALRDKIDSIDLAAHIKAAIAAPRPVQTGFDVEETRNGRRIGIINMAGPMMKGQSSLGGASTIATRRAIRQARDDAEVHGILLRIDSPGGTVAGTADLAADVRSAARKKPLFVHAEDTLASAAYWVASQADEIWANAPTALVGSIGTLLSVVESAGRAERLGQRERVFSTGPLKDVGGDSPITDEQSEYLQRLVNDLQTEFDAAVKKGRRLSAAQMEQVKTGAVFPAGEAQRLGLINGVRPLEATIEALASTR